jgi:hypothetical protein
MWDKALAAGDALVGGSSMQCQSAGGKATGLRATLWCSLDQVQSEVLYAGGFCLCAMIPTSTCTPLFD